MFDPLVDELHALTDAEKGRAFERLCSWYLRSAPEYAALIARVWLWDEWPGRWGPDAGIDLIAETVAGEVWAIQAKAYSPQYTITKADVDSFLAESGRPQISYRLLIATTDRLGAKAARTLHEQEKPAGVKLLSQLRAEDVSWPTSLSDLRPAPHVRKRPRSHQRDAVRDVVSGLDRESRGQLLMACGTGKTLTALWIDEAVQSERTLVLVPSLSLLGQTLRAWAANAQTPFEYLAVCSDATVANTDDFTEHVADLGFPVTTDPRHVAKFLRRRSGRRVVLATYQSSPVVARAQAERGVPRFDLAFADEAHRCAGPVDSAFAKILDAAEIRAAKRLFVTATPRYFTGAIKRAGAERDYEVVSMDDRAAFGPVLHRLAFAEAIDRGLLADYRVLVVGVDEPAYARYAQRGEMVTHDGKAVRDARTLARQIGLARAMRRFDLRRVITFHGTVAAARRFADDMPNVIGWMPESDRPSGSVWASHVSGAMNAGQRDALLDRLRQLHAGERGLLSNARCLAEGVDVPSIDGIAFIDPRRSTVDIIQAVGRAMRNAPDKTLGTIVVPVFVETGASAEAALDTSAFKAVWEIVRALRAHDDLLADQLDDARRRIGREGDAAIRPGRIVVDIPRRVGAGFATAFDARLVERTTTSWEWWYGLLERRVRACGNADVPVKEEFEGHNLGTWVRSQRTNRERLSAARAARLERLPGWVWDSHGARWNEGIAALESFTAREGNARVHFQHIENGFPLGQWVARQRRSRSMLTPDRRAQLESVLGWTWSANTAKWEEGLAALDAFVARERHARVPYEHEENGFPLGKWVSVLRRRRGRLDPQRVARLEATRGWAWNTYEAAWEDGFAALEDYVTRHGDARPSNRDLHNGYPVGSWVAEQRRKRATLSPDRVSRLEALPGWAWKVRRGRAP